MKHLTSQTKTGPAGVAIALAAAVAAIAAAQGSAAPHGLGAAALDQGALSVEGTPAGEKIALRLEAGRPGILQVDFGDDGSAEFSFARAEVSSITVDAGGGDDSVRVDDANGAVSGATPTRLDGGAGDDTIAGGGGAEILIGGPGRDSIDGNRGGDTAFMGAGDDTFVWDPGDGSDVVEGQDGRDTMLFNGAAGAEQFDLSANGERLRFFRNVGNITMDTNGVEQVDVDALGGADVTTMHDLAGTDVDEVNVDLGAPDGAADRVVLDGTDGKDKIHVSGDADDVKVRGLAADLHVLHPEPALDRLEMQNLAGKDRVDTHRLAPGSIQLAF